MKVNLNDSEIMAILTHIDDVLGYDLEPLERTTWLTILSKIYDATQFKHHITIDNFCFAIREVNGVN